MKQLCVIPGDGIGKEVIPAAVKVIQHVMPDVKIMYAEAGWECFLACGVSVPDETIRSIRICGTALFGAVSSPSRKVEGYRSAIITLRQVLNLYANIRPVRSLPKVSPRSDIDMLIIRENTEDLYSGREHMEGDSAIAERVISPQASYRIATRALDLTAQLGRKRLTIVHKANVLPLTDGLFRDVVRKTLEDGNSQLEVNELLVDVAALKIASQPECIDTIVTTNMFGDILSDEAACWMGGLGYAPSINFGDDVILAEPVHGSAPDIAGKGIANPIAAMLSAALLVRYAWGKRDEAQAIENAVNATLEQGIGLPGFSSSSSSTENILNAVLEQLKKAADW